jgi:hypothetical protein
MTNNPLILTLRLDEQSFTFFNALRKLHFPPALNYLSAHLTLFHHLPPNEASISDDLEKWACELSPFYMHVTEVKSIGKGVVYKINCPPLATLHKKMQHHWQQWLTAQDKQKLWPHVTVQNKVTLAEAKETLQTLQASFQPFIATGIGLSLWTYEGGPWKPVEDYLFAMA